MPFVRKPHAPSATRFDFPGPGARRRSIVIALGTVMLAGGLGGCGTINEKLAVGVGDYVPQWAGGLPADAPPRPGTAKYDAYMKEVERRRSLPPAQREEAEKSNPASGSID